jgi:hypothetical protein
VCWQAGHSILLHAPCLPSGPSRLGAIIALSIFPSQPSYLSVCLCECVSPCVPRRISRTAPYGLPCWITRLSLQAPSYIHMHMLGQGQPIDNKAFVQYSIYTVFETRLQPGSFSVCLRLSEEFQSTGRSAATHPVYLFLRLGFLFSCRKTAFPACQKIDNPKRGKPAKREEILIEVHKEALEKQRATGKSIYKRRKAQSIAREIRKRTREISQSVSCLLLPF